jgi:uncharacterized membrane protein
MARSSRLILVATALAAALSTLCLALLALRIRHSGSDTFAFMAWNLLLAWIPLTLALLLPNRIGARPWVAAPLLGVWLLFFPNAPYLATDLIHLSHRSTGSPAIDFVMFPAFAVAGLFIGALALYVVRSEVAARHGSRVAAIATAAVVALAGFGIYLGRIPQWNSWDLLVRPGALMAGVADRLADTRGLAAAIAVTAGSAACIGISHAVFRRAAQRVARRSSAVSAEARPAPR